MSTLNFTRNDYRSLELTCLAGVIGTPLLLLGLPLRNWVSGEGITREVIRFGKSAAVDSGAGTTAVSKVVTVTVTEPSVALRLSDLASASIVAIAAIVVGTALLRLSRRTRTGEPFTDGAVWALRGIAVAMMLTPPLHGLVDSFVESAISERAFGSGLTIGTQVTGAGMALMFVGLGFGVLAEAFRQGKRIRDDVDGLV